MTKKHFVIISALLVAGLLHAHAQETVSQSPDAPGKYKLELIRVADSEPVECLRTIQGFDVGYKSLYSPTLRQWVKSRSAGSSIEWFQSCKQMGCEPTEKETKDFQAFCKAEGKAFIVHPSG